MIVRPAEARDSPAVAVIWNPVIRDTEVTFNSVEKTEAELAGLFAQKAAGGHAFLVAEEDGEILGFASYGQFRAGVGYARTMEHTVILAPGARGRGIGRALMRGVEDHARTAGAHTIFAGVSSGNPDGIAFHERLGYAQVAVLKEVGWKFGRWFDLHLLQKRL